MHRPKPKPEPEAPHQKPSFPPEAITPSEILAAVFTAATVLPPEPPTSPIDLREIPRDRWDGFLCYPLLLPPEVAAYVAGAPDIPVSILEKDHIEEAVIRFHSITPPFTAVFRHGIARLMKE